MTQLGKLPSQAGFEPGIFRSRGGRLNHKANEAADDDNDDANDGCDFDENSQLICRVGLGGMTEK